jgi:hypothetical protein
MAKKGKTARCGPFSLSWPFNITYATDRFCYKEQFYSALLLCLLAYAPVADDTFRTLGVR